MTPALQATSFAITARAIALIANLSRFGISGELLPRDFRPYMGKVKLTREGKLVGKVVIHFSPKRNSFAITLNEVPDLNVHAPVRAAFDGTLDISVAQKFTVQSDLPIAYGDGSYLTGFTGYGLAVYRQGKLIHSECGVVPEKFEGMRQVGGEIYAAMRAVGWAKANGETRIVLRHDYLGVQKWATGDWKTNLAATAEYSKFMREDVVEVIFEKVAAHSGDEGNDKADSLAKKGAMSGRLNS